MSATTLSLELCAPQKPHLQLEVADVTVPGSAGVFAIYPGHTPILSTLHPGVLVATDPQGEAHYFAVHGGFVEVKNDKVVILATYFEPQDDIVFDRAQEAGERAAQLLRKPTEDLDWQRAELALSRSMARQHASKRSGYN